VQLDLSTPAYRITDSPDDHVRVAWSTSNGAEAEHVSVRISSMRAASVAWRAGGRSPASTRRPEVRCEPPRRDRDDQGPRERHGQRIEGRRVFREFLAGVEGEQGDVARRGTRQDTTRDPLRRRRDEGIQCEKLSGGNVAMRFQSLLARSRFAGDWRTAAH
jgi:hypothetical protein